ncbi:hypothetical protein GCM10009557_59430 [Virgisporangium ochraceum]|uniref:Uncharacterized protein n=1 Tax=Virgisporangium ochraceum TaxID=65505 RepID=A0A8J3ZSJ8_9ACTN|nr:hypothetical protein [Virgisporangium ochraceum]GIJ68223.1 hypothetical protein Voc01_031400 [Virgisporangium ochraceum]
MNDDNNAVTVNVPAIACDLTDAPDTADERMAEYARLFSQALAGRDRTDGGVRLRFRADEDVAAWVRDLAVREKACCPFYNFTVSTTGGEVWWDISLVDGVADGDEHTARAMLDGYFYAPDYAADGVAGMTKWLAGEGFTVTPNESGMVMQFDAAAADEAPSGA